jgi:hypothetical protein
MLLSVRYVTIVAASDVRDVVLISERVSSDVVLLPRYVSDIGDVSERVSGDVVLLPRYVSDIRHVSHRVSGDVVLLPRYVSDIRHVPVRVALDVYLLFGSLAILFLHSVLLSITEFRSTFTRRHSYEGSSLLLVKAHQTLRSFARWAPYGAASRSPLPP